MLEFELWPELERSYSSFKSKVDFRRAFPIIWQFRNSQFSERIKTLEFALSSIPGKLRNQLRAQFPVGCSKRGQVRTGRAFDPGRGLGAWKFQVGISLLGVTDDIRFKCWCGLRGVSVDFEPIFESVPVSMWEIPKWFVVNPCNYPYLSVGQKMSSI